MMYEARDLWSSAINLWMNLLLLATLLNISASKVSYSSSKPPKRTNNPANAHLANPCTQSVHKILPVRQSKIIKTSDMEIGEVTRNTHLMTCTTHSENFIRRHRADGIVDGGGRVWASRGDDEATLRWSYHGHPTHCSTHHSPDGPTQHTSGKDRVYEISIRRTS